MLLLFSQNQILPMNEWVKENPLVTITGALVLGGIIGYSLTKSSIPTISLSDFIPDFNTIVDTITPSFNDNLDHVYTLIEENKTASKPLFIFPENATLEDKALFIACDKGYIQCVKTLLKNKTINVNILVESIFYYGKSLKKTIKSFTNPLWRTLKNKQVNIVTLLLAHKNIQIIDKKLYPDAALTVACEYGNNNVISSLLDFPVHNISDDYWSKPLIIACEKKHLNVVTILLTHEKIIKDFEALFYACRSGSLDMAKAVINNDKKCILNWNLFTKKRLYTFLITTAVTNGYLNIFEFLLQPTTMQSLHNSIEYKPSIDWEEFFDENKSPHKKEIIQLLIHYNHINITDPSSAILLRIAGTKNIEWINALIDAGINYNTQDIGFAFLGFLNGTIASFDDLKFFKQLTAEEQNKFIQKELFYAAQYSSQDISFAAEHRRWNFSIYKEPFIVDEFITKVSSKNLTIRNKHGKLPLEIAYEQYKSLDTQYKQQSKHKNDDRDALYKQTTLKNNALFSYHSFLRLTPITSASNIYTALREKNFIPDDVVKHIMLYYRLLTLERDVEKDYLLKFKNKIEAKQKKRYPKKHSIYPKSLLDKIDKKIDTQYQQLGSISPFDK